MPTSGEVAGVIPPTPYVRDGITPRHLCCTEDGRHVLYATPLGVCLRALPGSTERSAGASGTVAPVVSYFTTALPGTPSNAAVIVVAACSQDGRLVVAGDTSGTLHLWSQNREGVSLKLWSLKTELTGHRGGGITDLAFSDDARQLVVVGYNGGIVVRVDSGSIVGPLMGHGDSGVPVSSVSFRHKKPYVIASAGMGRKGVVCFHEYEAELRFAHRAEVESPVYCVRFSPDGDRLVSCSGDGRVDGWSILTGERDHTVPVSDQALLSLSWSQDSKRVAVVGVDRMVRIVDMLSGWILESIVAGDHLPLTPVGVCWSTIDWLVTLCADGRFWGFKTEQQQQMILDQQFVWSGAQSALTCMSRPSSSGAVIVAADTRGTLTFVDYGSAEPHTISQEQLGVPLSIVAVALGKSCGVMITADGCACVFAVPQPTSVAGKTTLALLGSLKRSSNTAELTNEQKLLKPVSSDHTAVKRVHGYGAGRISITAEGPAVVDATRTTFVSGTWSLKTVLVDVLLLDGERVCAVLSRNGQIVVFPFQGALSKFGPLYSLNVQGTILAAAVTPDGGLLAVALIPNDMYPADRLKTGRGSTTKPPCVIELYEIGDATTASGFQFVCVYDCHTCEVTALALNASGTYIASADTEKNICVVEIESGKQRIGKEWKHHTETITSLAWNPSGNLLTSGSLDGRIGIWDIQSPSQKVLVPVFDAYGVTCTAFISDSTIVCGGKSGTMSVVAVKFDG